MALHWVDLIKSPEEEEEAHNFHKWQWMTYLYSLMMSTEIRIIRNERHDWSTLRSLLQGRELLWIPWINSIGHDWIAMRTIISTTGKVLANKMVKLTGTTEICTSDWLCILYRMVSSGSDCLTENWLHFCDMYYASERGRSKSYMDIGYMDFIWSGTKFTQPINCKLMVYQCMRLVNTNISLRIFGFSTQGHMRIIFVISLCPGIGQRPNKYF